MLIIFSPFGVKLSPKADVMDQAIDYRLVVALNYLKCPSYKSSHLPFDISVCCIGWGSAVEVMQLTAFHHSFRDEWDKCAETMPLADFYDILIQLETNWWSDYIIPVIQRYNIKNIYTYGKNPNIERLMDLTRAKCDSFNVHDIRSIATSTTSSVIDWRTKRMPDQYFHRINTMIRKISTIFALRFVREGFDTPYLAAVSEGKTLEYFYDQKKLIARKLNYKEAKHLIEVNTIMVLFLRRIIDCEFSNGKFSDISRRSSDVIQILNLIYLCIMRPNHFHWLRVNDLDSLKFEVHDPVRSYQLTFNSSENFEIPLRIINFIATNIQDCFDNEEKSIIHYEKNDLCNNFLSFIHKSNIYQNLQI